MKRYRLLHHIALAFALASLPLAGILLWAQQPRPQPAAPSGQAHREPLSEKEIVDLLKAGVTSTRVGVLARQYGVSFQLTPQTETHLRQAKASESLLKTLQEMTPKPPVSAPPAPPPPVLVIDANPGGAQVYLDDELMGTASKEGLLKISRVAPGEHKVRLSLAGYSEYVRTVNFGAGETVRFLVDLRALKAGEQARGELLPNPSHGETAESVAKGSEERPSSLVRAEIWRSETTGKEYRVQVDQDRFSAEWVNLPPESAKRGAYIRNECRRVGPKWIGTSRIHLPCAAGEGAKEHIVNTCRLQLRIEIISVQADRIVGRGQTLKRFDCQSCRVDETGWGDFVWVPKTPRR